MADTALMHAALVYAAAGLPVFPLAPCAKLPAIKGGFHAATSNPETIKRMWRIADRNIGIPTGIASGFWVLDIDPGGQEHLDALEREHGQLPQTRTVITPRGGVHYWFRYVGPVPSTAGKIAPHIDTRGDGAYVVVPPSVGPAGRAYSWSGDPQAPLALAPDWLIALARKRPSISERAVAGISNSGHRPPFGNSPAYGRAALDREAAALAATPAGQRNHALNLASFRLHQLVAGGELHGNEVLRHLVDACEANGLVGDDGLRSVQETIRSGAKAGLKFPRSRKGAA